MAAAILLKVWPQMLPSHQKPALPRWQKLFFDHAGHFFSAGESRPWNNLNQTHAHARNAANSGSSHNFHSRSSDGRSALPQTYQEVIDIIKSYDNPAGIKLEIGMAFWGGCTELNGKTRCEGRISGWHSQDKGQHEKLAVKWDGYDWNQKAELVAMDTDEHGNSLGLKLLADDDGALPTKQLPQAAPAAPAQPQQPPRQQQAAAGGEEIDKNGHKWRRRSPTYVNEDARQKERSKPRLQAGGLSLHSMMSLFLFLLPDKWVTDILKYTNPLLDDSDAINKKLTKGELLRFMGYMLILTLQNYLPVEKMWQKESPKGTTAPPPAMGRFGMSIGRFNKLKSVLRFGPEDTDAFQDNEWCFVEGLVTALASTTT